MSIRESDAQAFECLREASKIFSIRTNGNGWTGNSRSENMKCRSMNLVLNILRRFLRTKQRHIILIYCVNF